GRRGPRGDARRGRDAARVARGGDREGIPSGGRADARGGEGAQGDQGPRTDRREDGEETPGDRGSTRGPDEGEGRGSGARARGQPGTPPGPGSGDCEADQGSGESAGIPPDGKRIEGAPRTRTRGRGHAVQGRARVGGGPVRRTRERSQRIPKGLGEDGAKPGVGPNGSRRFPPPSSGSGKDVYRRTHEGAKCARGRKGEGRAPQGRSRRASQARGQGRRTERQGIRAQGPARKTRSPIEGPRGSRSLLRCERGPRPRARSRVREGFPLRGGTSPRGGDGPEGDQRARARPRESREEIRGEAAGADATGKDERGDALEGTRRGSQAAPGTRPRKREADQGGRGAAGVRSGRQRVSRATRTRTRSRNHEAEGRA